MTQCLLLFLTTIVFGISASFAENPLEDAKVQYIPYNQAIVGMSSKEAEAIKPVFDENKVIDLEASGLTELLSWTERLNQRLTQAIEKQGSHYPFYKIYFLASDEVEAYVLKSQIPGHKTYRAHVFFSTGMIKKMLETLGTDLESATPEQLRRLLLGVQGIFMHEFLHPKQDELVKWQWRQAQERSRQSHGQIDELTTDLLTLPIAKEARLDPKSLLTGLELLFGDEGTQTSLNGRALTAATSTHPENELRLNLIRGGLTNQRLTQGKVDIDPIGYSEVSIKQNLKAALSAGITSSILAHELDQKPGSRIINLLHHLRTEVKRPTSDEKADRDYLSYLDHLDALVEEEKKNGRFSDIEMQEFLKFMDYMVQDGRFDTRYHDWRRQKWMIQSSESGSYERDSLAPRLEHVREIQARFKRLHVFSDSRFKQWLDQRLAENFLGFVQSKNSSFEAMPWVLPRENALVIFKQGLSLIRALPPEEYAVQLLKLWHGIGTIGAPPDLEAALIRDLIALVQNQPEAIPTIAGSISNIMESEAIESRKRFTEKFVRYRATHPKETEELLSAYAELVREYLKSPERVLQFGVIFQTRLYKVIATLGWQLDPKTRFLPLQINQPFRAPNLAGYLADLFRREPWKSELENTANEFSFEENENRKQRDEPLAVGILLDNLNQLGYGDEREFRDADIYPWLEALLEAVKDPSSREQMSYAMHVLKEFYRRHSFVKEASARFVARLSAGDRVLAKKIAREWAWTREVFDGDPAAYVEFCQVLKNHNLLTEADVQELTASTFIDPANLSYALSLIKGHAAYQFHKTLKASGKSKSLFLKEILKQFALSRFDVTTFKGGRYGARTEIQEIQDALTAGLAYWPKYARVMSRVAPIILAEFREEHGLEKSWSSNDTRYVEEFKQNFSEILEHIKLIFNPDGVGLKMELKSLADFKTLDDLTAEFFDLIPKSGLSAAQYEALWWEMSAKRANRYTDELFGKYVRQSLNKDEKEILETGRVRSEKYKIGLMERVFEPKLKELEALNVLSESKVVSLMDAISRFAPDASPYRDEWIEKIAGRLGLSEGQVIKFIEPLKSFNFMSVDPATLNLLSMASVLIDKLSVKEKLRLLEYVQEPRGDLLSLLPTLRNGVDDLSKAVEQMTGDRFSDEKILDLVEKLEGFIRDSNETQRLVLAEMVVGTRKSGLWYQGEGVRQQLFGSAGLSSKNLQIFLTYQSKMPEHERTIALSYLIAKAEKSGEFEMLPFFEMHGPVGDKGAQTASVLAIFGEVQALKLAKAKSRNDRLSRKDAFAALREVYNGTDRFSHVKNIKSQWSGAIKHVLIVAFDDQPNEAVYIKRKHLKEVTTSTMDFLDSFVAGLRDLPDYKDAYEYEHYLQLIRTQIANEGDFLKELELSREMAAKYAKAKAVDGWRFQPVWPSQSKSPQTKDVLHYLAIEGAVPFESLSGVDQQSVSRLILDTEFKFLFKDGVFDADRHLGNYLFDPVRKLLYAIDFGQVYRIKKSSFFGQGETSAIARIIYGLEMKDTALAAKEIREALFSVSENGKDVSNDRIGVIDAKIATVLRTRAPEKVRERLLGILGVLTEARIHLPLTFSLGVMKATMILTYEKYAKVAGFEYVRSQLSKHVKRELVFGKISRCVQLLTGAK